MAKEKIKRDGQEKSWAGVGLVVGLRRKEEEARTEGEGKRKKLGIGLLGDAKAGNRWAERNQLEQDQLEKKEEICGKDGGTRIGLRKRGIGHERKKWKGEGVEGLSFSIAGHISRVQKKDMFCALKQELHQGPPRYMYCRNFISDRPRKKFMSTIVRKFEIANGWSGKLCPRVTIQLKETEIQSTVCIVMPAGRELFEVMEGNTHFKVDLNSGCCDCRVWDISGIPCKHAIRCILTDREDTESYVHDAYTVEKYRAAYDVIIKPITDPIFWEDSDYPRLGPPEIEVNRGRPPSKRRRDGTEKRKSFIRSSTLRCSVCKQYGHNSRSHREGGKLSILRGKDKPSYKSKTSSTRKVGRPPKQPSQPSNDVTSQPSTSLSKKGKKRKVSICGTSAVKRARKGKASL
ncbi:hypothetical protein Cgig2_008868 [Carnegiea gigantea]|uniref:SWIM-type domain-containing protein n=1 Tax=Carnegiea gigantea TaxID=171969 RepID=A0A9Q1JKL4_9CARY|nr:hypothetical protein Cgig2_008868 [Carnegiea gigantea]